ARSLKNGNYGQPPPQRTYTPPTGPTNFSAISARINALKNQGGLKPADRETAKRLQEYEKAAEAMKPESKNLKRVLEYVDATMKKGDLERNLKRAQEQMATQKAALDQEKKRIDGEKVQLLLR